MTIASAWLKPDLCLPEGLCLDFKNQLTGAISARFFKTNGLKVFWNSDSLLEVPQAEFPTFEGD